MATRGEAGESSGEDTGPSKGTARTEGEGVSAQEEATGGGNKIKFKYILFKLKWQQYLLCDTNSAHTLILVYNLFFDNKQPLVLLN